MSALLAGATVHQARNVCNISVAVSKIDKMVERVRIAGVVLITCGVSSICAGIMSQPKRVPYLVCNYLG